MFKHGLMSVSSNDGAPLQSRSDDLEISLAYSAGEATAGALPEKFLKCFPQMVRDVSLFGDIPLLSITSCQREALTALVSSYGPSCIAVVADSEGRFHLRSGPENPYLPAMLAKELRYLHDEGSKAPEDNPLVLKWAFTNRSVHREVVTLLQLLAQDMGVFCGEKLFDGVYLYRIEVALHYLPQWEAERRKILNLSVEVGADPFPIPVQTLQNPRLMDMYRRCVRPFLYEWNYTTTRCDLNIRREPNGQVPREVRALGASFSLRHEVNSSGYAFFRRWTRHLVQVFSKYAAELKRQDSKGVERTLASYGGDLDLVDVETTTPHFGFFTYCLEGHYFRKDLGELEELARRTGYYMYVSMEKDLAMVTATARARPALGEGFVLLYPKAGSNLQKTTKYEPPSYEVAGMPRGMPQQTSTYHQLQQCSPSGVHKGVPQAVPGRCADVVPPMHFGENSSGENSSGTSSSSDSSSDSDSSSVSEDSRWKAPTNTTEVRASLPPILSVMRESENKSNSSRRLSLAASSLYDTIVGRLQRNLPPGWNVRLGPDGRRYILDHLRGRAYDRDSPVISMEYAAAQRELYRVSDSLA
ncbi:hypothetical protein DQ04_01091030 [Trypanosoma grayi]|uniref:hypothetical protein n=1 Tax=Trypanosoma grayi TaxID=71804 RepID=UPI0004F3FEBF|nr:hypothetical protein DQ04_01091030 [Trypanosoma grayi]KEG13296.1 hypothetical protein DQ04_01091030 [Trypanosoma grayi]